MSVIIKKDEKMAAVVEGLAPGFTFEQFLEAFQLKYPKDWARVESEWRKHERKNKGKGHPMPEPVQYMRNALNVYLKASRKAVQ